MPSLIKVAFFLCCILITGSFSFYGSGKDLNRQNFAHESDVIEQIKLPEGFERKDVTEGSFASYLRRQRIKQENNIVYLYNNKPKINQDAQYCVLTVDVGIRDLQQCADAVMRLRAEYLFQNKQINKIHFNFTSGDTARYSEYIKGYRAVVQGNTVKWKKKAAIDTSYKAFRNYLNLVFTYAGTHSLSKELEPVADIGAIEIGDVFIQTGQPYGHAVIVVDVAENEATGEKIFLLAQSYMPAQEIHILKNPVNYELSPWYSVNFEDELKTPEWTFYKKDLKKFK